MARLDLGKVTGDDGYSPTVETSKSGKTTTITITDVNGVHTATILDGEDGAAASGDMKKSVYDTNDNGIVDNAEKVNNHTVGCDVPADAVFTDTTYSVATTEANGLMSSTDKTKLNGIASGAEANVQANWNESNTSSDAYIQNKPTIPDELADLSDDSTHRLVTDTEKSTWNNKSDEVIQYSTMPTASSTNLDKIVQYIGASVANSYTNGYFYKCVSDGQSTPTYSWEEVEVQAGGGGTITSVKMNGSTVATSGEADLGTVVTDVSGKMDNPTVTTNSDSTYTIASLTGNKVYKLSTITALTITATTTFDTETVIYFASGSTATSVSLPASITNLGDAPTMTTASSVNTGTCEASKSYIISVLNNIAIWRAY